MDYTLRPTEAKVQRHFVPVMRKVTNKSLLDRDAWEALRWPALVPITAASPTLRPEHSLQGFLGIKEIPLHPHVPVALRNVLVCVGSVLFDGLERVGEACY